MSGMLNGMVCEGMGGMKKFIIKLASRVYYCWSGYFVGICISENVIL